MKRSKAQTIAHAAALEIETLVKNCGVRGNPECDLPHWPGVHSRLLLWARIEGAVVRAIRKARPK